MFKKACPCGCGRKLGAIKRGWMKRTIAMAQVATTLQPLLDDDTPPELAKEMHAAIVEGDRIIGAMVEHVHGPSDAMIPEMHQVADYGSRAMALGRRAIAARQA